MANAYTGNPWILDEAATIKTSGVSIQKMEWIPNAAADDLTVKDGAALIVWDVDALTGGTAGKEVIDFPGVLHINGFELDTIDGGTLYVYIK